MKNNREFIQKTKKKFESQNCGPARGASVVHVIVICVYIIIVIGHNNQIFIKKSCGPAWLCPDNAFRVTALVTVGGAIAGVHRPGRSADSESESACQAGLTPSQHAELVTRTRVTVLGPAVLSEPRSGRRLRRQAPGSRAGAWWPKLGNDQRRGSDSESLRLAA